MANSNIATLPTENPHFTAEQLELVLEDIAQQAELISALCSQAVVTASPADFEECAVILTGMQALIERVGWLADFHGGCNVKRGDPLKWMLPPAYHWNAETPQATAGSEA